MIMRTEEEMLNLIINTAKQDENIRAVIMVGSRTDINAPKDIFRDFDIGYHIKSKDDMIKYWNNLEWVEEKFGKILICQMPELMAGADNDGHFTYLAIFEDGNRIDLSINYNEYNDDGEPAIVLVDKDNKYSYLPKTLNECTERAVFWNIIKPSEKEFHDTCNEFWWCLNNVAKGIMRDELPYVKDMLNKYVRDCFERMLAWLIGVLNDFKVSTGKSGKYYKRYLSKSMYSKYLKTFSDGDYENIWQSIYTMCELFRESAMYIAEELGFTYKRCEDIGMMRYFDIVKNA